MQHGCFRMVFVGNRCGRDVIAINLLGIVMLIQRKLFEFRGQAQSDFALRNDSSIHDVLHAIQSRHFLFLQFHLTPNSLPPAFESPDDRPSAFTK